jgi:hypothetical protein
MKTVQQILSGIAHSTGTSKYIKSRLWGHLVFTDGVDALRNNADAFWLVDAIASYKRKEPFQVWDLTVDTKKHTAVLTMKEDSDQPELVRQEIEYTDFPLDNIRFFVQEGGYGTEENWTPCLVLMLTNEY